ncbi:MAG: sulfotransferase domain-containing protein [Victivallales bacterium]|nr:sulfotransferase domain-containing protein [Victivallales bacterium]
MSDHLGGKKALIFVSPGRCGTTRIAEILREKLPREEFAVTHQMPFSRLANVVGNLMYYFGQSEKIKEKLYDLIVARYINGKHFITTDPLTAMIIPKKWVESENVCIVQITRDPEEFAESFYRFSRKKTKSFISHNFIPFWQPGVLPLENFLGRGIKSKYKKVQKKKEVFFDTVYAGNVNYIKVDIHKLFDTDFITGLIHSYFCQPLELKPGELSVKSNQSRI